MKSRRTSRSTAVLGWATTLRAHSIPTFKATAAARMVSSSSMVRSKTCGTAKLATWGWRSASGSTRLPHRHVAFVRLTGHAKLSPSERHAIDAGREVDIVYAVGHQHVGGAGIRLIRDATDELICESKPIYGTSDRVGDELGYVVGMTPCIFGYEHGLRKPFRIRSDEVVRTESTYNTTYAHFGVMSLWLVNVADVPAPAAA